MARQSNDNLPFCAISAGLNECEICNTECIFGLHLPQVPSQRRRMELFRCGHGMCSVCYSTMTADEKNFSCPFCRDSGCFFLKSFGSSEKGGRADTFNQWDTEFSSFRQISLRSQHPFAVLYRQILTDYRREKEASQKRRTVAKVIAKRVREKEKRVESEREATCPHCGKDTFTSMKQLGVHLATKHSSSGAVSKKKKSRGGRR